MTCMRVSFDKLRTSLPRTVLHGDKPTPTGEEFQPFLFPGSGPGQAWLVALRGGLSRAIGTSFGHRLTVPPPV